MISLCVQLIYGCVQINGDREAVTTVKFAVRIFLFTREVVRMQEGVLRVKKFYGKNEYYPYIPS